MVTIEVRLYASLRKYCAGSESGEALTITMDDTARLGNLLDELKVPREEVTIAMVNGKREKKHYLLQDRDRVGLFPPIGGG